MIFFLYCQHGLETKERMDQPIKEGQGKQGEEGRDAVCNGTERKVERK